MTPLKAIAWRGVKVYGVDQADKLELLCLATTEKKAEWIAWSLGRAHAVEHVRLETDGQVASL